MRSFLFLPSVVSFFSCNDCKWRKNSNQNLKQYLIEAKFLLLNQIIFYKFMEVWYNITAIALTYLPLTSNCREENHVRLILIYNLKLSIKAKKI